MSVFYFPGISRKERFARFVSKAFSFLTGLLVALSGFLTAPILADDSSAQKAELVDLTFQKDMQYAMRRILYDIHGSSIAEDESSPAEFQLDENQLSEILSLDNPELLAQNDSTEQSGGQSTAEYEISSSDHSQDTEDIVTLNFQGADINALINLVSQVTKKSFIVDPRVRGKVTLVSGGGLPVDQLYEIFLSVLEVSNFAAVEAGTITKILPKNLIKQHPTPTNDERTPDITDEHYTHIVTLKHASVSELLPILRPLLPPTAHIAPHVGSNTLILTGTGSNINRALSLIHRMDKEQRGIDIQVIFLDHADATKLAPIISQAVTSFTAESARQGQAPSSISVQVDEGLNALIVQAPTQDFAVIQALVDQLDIPRLISSDIHVVYLKYAQATDLVTLLTGLQQPQALDEAGAVPRSEVSIQADEQSNSLIIRAEKEDFEGIKFIIEELDVRRKQVFIEVIIAEVSFNKESELGVSWASNYQGSGGGDLSLGTEFASEQGGIKLGFVNRFFTNLRNGAVPNLEIVLRALRTDNNTNIISTPNLLTLDNEEAEITVGQEVPFITGKFSDTANNENGVINPFQTIERKDVGLTLKITPQINDGDTIRLEIAQELSSVNPTTIKGASDLITDTRSITATVQVEDDQVVVLGGLIRDDAMDIHEWVPGLGKIPILGALFRKKRKTAVKTNLMVFLQPKIIRTPEDLASITRDRYEFIRAEEVQSQPATRNLLPDLNPALKQRQWLDAIQNER